MTQDELIEKALEQSGRRAADGTTQEQISRMGFETAQAIGYTLGALLLLVVFTLGVLIVRRL